MKLSLLSCSLIALTTSFYAYADEHQHLDILGGVNLTVVPFDSAVARNLSLALSSARLGFSFSKDAWSTKLMFEGSGGGSELSSSSGFYITDATVSYVVDSDLGLGVQVGRSSVTQLRRWGSLLAIEGADAHYGSQDAIAFTNNFTVGDISLNAELTLGNQLGTTPSTDLNSVGTFVPSKHAPGLNLTAKKGMAYSVLASVSMHDLLLGFKYASETNRFYVAQSEIATRTKPDGKVAETYSDIQVNLGYSLGQIDTGLWYQKRKRSALKVAALDAASGIVHFGKESDEDPQALDEYGWGLEYFWNEDRQASEQLYTGFSVEMARSATDNLNEAGQKREDEHDYMQLGLTQGLKEGAFEVSLTMAMARTKGAVLAKAGDAEKSKSRIFSFIRLGYSL